MDPAPAATAASDAGPGRQQRPWGWFETLGQGEGYLVKRLWLQAGRRISLQRHRHRCEHWVVVRGVGLVFCDGRERQVVSGDSLFIPQGAIHRATAGAEDLELIEVQRGLLLSEADIERFEDDFGRVIGSDVTL